MSFQNPKQSLKSKTNKANKNVKSKERTDLNAAVAGVAGDDYGSRLGAFDGDMERNAKTFTGKPGFLEIGAKRGLVRVLMMIFFVFFLFLLVFHFVASIIFSKSKKPR